jgi:hypothetical protein
VSNFSFAQVARWPRLARGLALALALVALSAMALQPICAAAEPVPGASQAWTGSQDGPADEFCCPQLDAVLAATTTPPSSEGAPLMLLLLPRPLLAPLQASFSGSVGPLFRTPPLPTPRYHARSARILR